MEERLSEKVRITKHDWAISPSKVGSKTRGQAIVEYILMLGVSLTVTIIISNSFNRLRKSFLRQIVREVTAPCPDCEPPGKVQSQIDRYLRRK